MSDANTNKKINSWGSNDSNSKNKAELLKAIADHKQIIASYESTRPTLSSYSNCTYYDNLYIPANKSVKLPSGEYHKKTIHLNFNSMIEQTIKKNAISGGYILNIDKYKNPVLESINKIDRIEIHSAPIIEKSDTNVKLKFNFKWSATIIFKTSDSGRYSVPIGGYITGYEMGFFSPADEDTKFKQSLDNIASLKNQMLSGTLTDKELADIQLTSIDSCDKFIGELNTPVQKPVTASLKDTLNTAIDAITLPGTSKIIDNVIGEVNKPATLERKLTKVEVIKKPYSSIQKSLSADDLKKAANKVDERFDKRIHNVNKGSNGDPYSLLTKLDRPGCIKMYPATKDGYADPERIDCFLIQAVQTSLREKFSIFQSLSGDVLAYFFGKQPVIYRFSAALYNTYNQQWWHDFRSHYDKRLRGTAAIKKNIRTVVSYEDHVIEGFFLEMNSNESTTNPALVNIDFSILLLQETVLGEYSEPADITGYREDADSLEMNASIRSADNGLDKPLSNAEINRNNVQAMLSIVPTMTTFSLPSGISSDVYNAALFPTADLEDYLNHLEPGTSGTITMDAATIPITEDGKPDMEKQVTKKNNAEVKNKDELNNKSIEYKKNEEVVASAKNKADDLANRTNTQYGETLKNGTVTVTNSDAKVRIQPNDNAELAEELATIATDYAYSKTSGSYYYIGKGWIKNTDVKDNTDSKNQDSKPFTTGKLQFHNPATVGRNNMVIRSERSSAQEYLIGTVEYRSGTRYTFTDHKGKWFYVINVPLTDGRVKSGWTFENNVTGIAYDN